MARVYLSFLGISDYQPCTYCFGEREVPGVRFVQEATAGLFCRDWGPADRLLIFTTEKAHRQNWLDDGHLGRDGRPQRQDGLETCLARLGLQAQVKHVTIPEGSNEEEIWRIFEILFEELRPGDEVVFDITHAFRSIPMLAVVALNYAKVLRRVSVQGIYYGAFEVLGTLREVEKLPLDQRRVPIFDLTPFAALLDWSTAIDRFLGAGDATLVSELAKSEVKPLLRNSLGRNAAAKAIESVAKGLKNLSEALSTCRGPELPAIISRLRENLQACPRPDLIPPFAPLLDNLAGKLQAFSAASPFPGFEAARWCLEHNLIQQGFTILLEALVTHLIQSVLSEDPQNPAYREIVTQSAHIHRDNIEESLWKSPARDYPSLVKKLLDFWDKTPALGKVLTELMAARNDINHAAWRAGSMPAREFAPKLQKLLNRSEHLLRGPHGSPPGKD